MMKHRLGERYIRIDEVQSKEQQDDLGLDVATSEVQEMLVGLGAESAKRILGRPEMTHILQHHAARPVFHHGKNKNSEES